MKFGQLLYRRRTLLKAGFDPRHALTNLERRIALIFVATYPIITLIVATVTYLITQHYLPPAAP